MAIAPPDKESTELFESRKADHIRLALDERMQTTGSSGLDRYRLIHEAFPEIDFSEVRLSTAFFGVEVAVPYFVSSMTAGHAGSLDLNRRLARVAGERGWPMGVGSQRRQLTDTTADAEWAKIRKECPRVRFLGNIGVAQLIRTSVDEVRRLCDTLQAEAMFVHANPLQEALQPEGTPNFRGGLQAIESLARHLGLPVVVKETGCGFSSSTLKRLMNTGVRAVDVSGLGGTHWGRIEGGRSVEGALLQQVSETFRDWGVPTVESLVAAVALQPDYEIWASGGVRSGLDAAKLLALGARHIGIAKPLIEAAIASEQELDICMQRFEQELKTAMFCTGSKDIMAIQEKRVWEKQT